MKTKKKFLSFLLCFMFLFLVGCPEGGPSDFYDPATTPLAMQGVKVLSKPADYNFKEAVGESYSEKYYNLFAREILSQLYLVYENDIPRDRSGIYKDIETGNGETYSVNVPADKDKPYYLYDTLRYTIANVETTKGEYGDLEKQKITFDVSSSWNWTIENGNVDNKISFDKKSTFFKNLKSLGGLASAITISENYVTIDCSTLGSLNLVDWIDFYTRSPYKEQAPTFSEFYTYPDGQVKVEGTENTNYWISPYYHFAADGKDLLGDADKANDPVNFFQDALEYAIYLFVLGFDYNADAADAPYFDFEVVYDTVETSSTFGHVTDVKVGGWGNEKISVSKGGENSALGKVKKLYGEVGGYVGITRLENGEQGEGKTNQEQIENFIKDKIIGEDALAKNIFEVPHKSTQESSRSTQSGDVNVVNEVTTRVEDGIEIKSTKNVTVSGGTTTTRIEEEYVQKFNRNYEKIVSNIVQYACNHTPIGFDENFVNEDGTTGKVLTLDQNFLASQITDYQGNYFGASKKGGKDDNLFEFIPAAEYQSFVIYPNEEDFDENLKKGKFQAIGDVWLAFEYWDDPRDTITPEADKNKARDKENGIVINVGFRYFDHEKGQFVANTVVKKEVSYGRFPIYKDENGKVNPNFEEEYDNHMAMFAKTDTAGCTPIGEVPIKTKFLYDIGNGAINPFASGTEIEGQETKSITITSSSRARDYYMTNASSSYGFYGTLNPDKFAGEGGCDYIEIYFDVQKTKGVLGKNYNFKVALYNFLASEDVFAND